MLPGIPSMQEILSLGLGTIKNKQTNNKITPYQGQKLHVTNRLLNVVGKNKRAENAEGISECTSVLFSEELICLV